MKTKNIRLRRLMRSRNRALVNRSNNQQQLFVPVFIMAMIRLGLEEQNTPEKMLTRLRLHIEKLEGNGHFPVTEPSLAELKALARALQKDIAGIAAGNHSLMPHRNKLEADADEMIRQLSYHIQFLSKGNEEKIKSSGFDTQKAKSPAPLPEQVMKLVAKPIGGGKIKLKWKKEKHAAFYFIEQISGPPIPGAQWNVAGKTSKVTFIIENLKPGQVYYFRVYASNGNVDGNPSDPTQQRSL